MRTSLPRAASVACLVLIAGCAKEAPKVLGTLEWDRIALPAPAAEKIVAIDVREGQQVAAGARLLQLEATRTRSQLDAVQAQAEQSREALAELQAGPRPEQIAQARANLAAAQAQAVDAHASIARLRPLAAKQLVAKADLDRAVAASGSADGQVRAAQAALDQLLNGTRKEEIAQGQAAAAAARAQAAVQEATLEKLDVVAPRAGRIDSIPYKLGDQAPVGSPLALLLVGDAPYARVYVPEPMRAGVHVGDAASVSVAGAAPIRGTVRMIRSEPVFTPYYALAGEDASRLSYLAEIQLGADAATLPAGLPVQVDFGGR